ncbi:uncharacterized protein LOC122088744 [Macadamia integrifolia]|uniref:uncharacterized protein LOC122088744 n=1 Tax=Macadamia integrifolia TaxID=60698 RepID=UPI001C4F5B72|nr:uncharacterized protein LOC122088744 [Macadamia integrifolia]
MPSQMIHSWTFRELFGAFLDLWLSLLLLCGSVLSFFASKFLGLFGWHLPDFLQMLLFDFPTQKITSVQMSVKTYFPFDSIGKNEQGCQLGVRSLGASDRCNEPKGMEGESSCSSISEAGRRSHSFALRNSSPKKELGGFGLMGSAELDGRADVKGKGVVNQRRRFGLRRRRKAVVEHRKSSSVSSSDPPRLMKREVSRSSYGMSEFGHDFSEEGLVPMNSARIALPDGREGHNLHGFGLNGSFGESKVVEKGASSPRELVCNVRDEQRFDGNEKNVIRILEQALEEEQGAHAALDMELEKERIAAATAADEAMAMILRLQKDKASTEMEARQYQRMIEEKSAYDAEEMDILKEILVRREKEKYFLEKEVETYRQLLEVDGNDMVEISAPRSTFPWDSSENPELMMRKIGESLDKREIEKNVKTSSNYEAQNVEGPSPAHALVKELPYSDWDKDANLLKQVDFQRKASSDKSHPLVPGSCDDGNQEVQEKGMVSMDEERSVLQREGPILERESRLYELNSPPKHGLLERTIISIDEEHGQKSNARQCQGVEVKADPNPCGTEINFPYDEELEKCGRNPDRRGSDQQFSKVETGPSLYDVHVIDDGSKLCKEEAREESQEQLADTASDKFRMHGLPFDPSGFSRIDAATGQPSTSSTETEQDVRTSRSDLTAGLPPISNRRGKSFSYLRRNSMSAVDDERLKLDTEVGWLRERLRIVKEGKEKLSFSLEHREREKIQLQLLEDIAKQLKEIRQLTEPGKAVRQASLPPISSKVSSKKRRCRNVSVALHYST